MPYPHNPRTYEKLASDLRRGDLVVRLAGHPTDEHIDRVESAESTGPTVTKLTVARFWTSPNRHPERVQGLTGPEYIGHKATVQVTYEPTEIALAEMLTENTGRHFLDSGGAYGRAWERNRAAAGNNPVEYFRNRPEIWQGWRGEEWATVDVFHYLAERLEYSPKLTRAFRMFVYANPKRYLNAGSEDMETFLAAGESRGWFDLSGDHFGGYTYNHENALSQDIVYQTFTVNDENPFDLWGEFVAISIHGGCDARGGFTDWRIFEIATYESTDFLDFDHYQMVWQCETERNRDPQQTELAGMPKRHPHEYYADVRGGYAEWYRTDGYSLRDEPAELSADDVDPDGIDPHGIYRQCPDCSGTLHLVDYIPPHTS